MWPGTKHQPDLLYLQIPADECPVLKFQNSEFLQPPLLSCCVKICMICAVIELIGRQIIILITPLPVEQSQGAVLNFSGWLSVRTQLLSPPANLYWPVESLLSICHFSSDHSSFRPVLSALCRVPTPVFYRCE